jgi:5'-3' exonuclease
MKPKIDLILIDVHNLGHRIYHTLQTDIQKEEIEADFLFVFLNSIQLIANKFETNNIIFAWDSKKSFRKKEYSNYKKRKRQELVINIYKQFNILKKEILPEIGFKNNLKQSGIEADDIIAKVCEQEKRMNKLIVSNDGDMRQCLDYFTWIWDGKKLLKKDEFSRQIHNLDPQVYYPKIKALAGCQSDNIKGIHGVGELTAAKYFADKRLLTKKKIGLIESEMWLMHKNLSFVKLPHEKTKDFKLTYNDFDKERTIKIFMKYNFESFLDNFNKWEIFYG